MQKHLAIFLKETIQQIFSGKKTVEVRFSQKRIAPYGAVSVGDIIYIKPPGGEIVGQFTAKKVIYMENFDKKDIEKFYNDFKADAHFATIIYMDNIEQFLTSPLKIPKKNLSGWMVL